MVGDAGKIISLAVKAVAQVLVQRAVGACRPAGGAFCVLMQVAAQQRVGFTLVG